MPRLHPVPLSTAAATTTTIIIIIMIIFFGADDSNLADCTVLYWREYQSSSGDRSCFRIPKPCTGSSGGCSK